jgi:predicted short-subunit dehydrogenase-like oxidoreductase (DUF2520 family)
MLPAMATKPRIAVVGPGNLGTVLAVSLKKAGFAIDTLIARSRRSLERAQRLAKEIGARATVDPAEATADVVWLCVPDSKIAAVSEALARELRWKGRFVFHSSGALTSNELSHLRRKGASVASVHPLMTFVRGSRSSLAGVPFAIEGDAKAVRLARRIVRDVGGQAYPIRSEDKVAYHAWGTFASPLVTALLATSERIASVAGASPNEARRRMIPILMQTLANYAAFGAPGAFSGPIIRGDVETVRRHLRVLKSVPVGRDVYASLARAALQYLPVKNRNALKLLLARGGR